MNHVQKKRTGGIDDVSYIGRQLAVAGHPLGEEASRLADGAGQAEIDGGVQNLPLQQAGNPRFHYFQITKKMYTCTRTVDWSSSSIEEVAILSV